MAMARRMAAATLGAVAAFGALTLVALEGGEVVVLRTRPEQGPPRETRTWIADADGASWIEAAAPERTFLGDIRADPRVAIWRGGRWLACTAAVEANPAGHDRIRRLLAAKYGWKDGWIGCLADTRRSLAVRLDCESA